MSALAIVVVENVEMSLAGDGRRGRVAAKPLEYGVIDSFHAGNLRDMLGREPGLPVESADVAWHRFLLLRASIPTSFGLNLPPKHSTAVSRPSFSCPKMDRE